MLVSESGGLEAASGAGGGATWLDGVANGDSSGHDTPDETGPASSVNRLGSRSSDDGDKSWCV